MKRLVALAVASLLVLPGCTQDDAPVPTPERTLTAPPTTPGLVEVRVGDSVELAAWNLTVTDIERDADATLHETNPQNDEPEGQYVLVTFEATYQGNKPTERVHQLRWSFVDAEAVEHDDTHALTPADAAEWPDVARPGETVKWQVLFDIDPDLIEGGRVTVWAYGRDYEKSYVAIPI